jgi:hypothetical protein
MKSLSDPDCWIPLTALILGFGSALVMRFATLREQVGRIVQSSKLWDRQFWKLQVTEAGERRLRLRVLATAADSGSAWDMRCEIREKLITYLQEQDPWALPRIRATLEGGLPAAT